ARLCRQPRSALFPYTTLFRSTERLGQRAFRRGLGARWWRLRRTGCGQVDLLPRAGRPSENDALTLGVNAHRLAADLAGQVERRFRHTVPRQLQRVGRHPRLQRLTHFDRCAEEAIRRHQAVYPLMRPLEVVVVDEQTDPTLRIAHVDE